MNRRQRHTDTPVGRLVLTTEDGWLTELTWAVTDRSDSDDTLLRAGGQLQDYFAGSRTSFDLPLAPRASAFQHCYNEALFSIRFGETRSYGDLARALEVSAQTVGQACAANPIPIIIPCHRVLASNGLGGYSGEGGIETKVALLRHEGAAGLLI